MSKRASTFPNHKYDFDESVYIPAIDAGGVVDGIWHCKEQKIWQYHLFGQTCWWKEDQLEPACPRCFMPWDGMTPCKHCGLSPDELT
jgi:hypothetical protein